MKEARIRRHIRIRKKISGTKEQPRMSVFRSANHLAVQLIDDTAQRTLMSCTTKDKQWAAAGHRGNVKSAAILGEIVAQRAKAQGISRVVFDRGGYKYHGRVKAVAEAARKAGLEF